MPNRFNPIFDPASAQTAAMAGLFELVLVICAVILAIVTALVVASLLRFRARPDAVEPRPYFGNRKLEIIWTAGPLLVVGWLFTLTAQGMRQADPPADQPPDIIVTGHQWWWEVRYLSGGVVTANEIHLPTGRKWLVRLASADVIHDFWVPELARKMQMIPGQTNQLWLEADTPGTYAGECAEYCGAQHAWMRLTVIAESPATFAAWLQHQEFPAAGPVSASAQNGLHLFQTLTCINCHPLRGVATGASAAPDLTHLVGRQTLGAGVLVLTETNLFRWLKDPQAGKPGCLMPDLKLTDPQARALVSYLETLQ